MNKPICLAPFIALLLALLVIMLPATHLKAAESKTKTAHPAVVADNAFATDIFGQLRETPGNICISPFSISSALDMTSAGAEGQTAVQMLGMLHWTDDRNQLPTAAAALSAEILANRDKPTAAQIEIANALFGQKEYPYRKEFLDLLSQRYQAELQPVDFVRHSDQALKQINDWAAKKTADKIQQALPASAVTSNTRLVLVNAVYFKGKWVEPFEKQATQDQPFFTTSTDSVKVPMMKQKQHLAYMEDKNLQAVEVPYNGGFSMVLILPRDRDGLAAVEKSLTAERVESTLHALKWGEVELSLPRFRMECEYDLNKPLEKLGMTDAFNPQKADFTGISSIEQLCISEVHHKTFIAVDEEGTEAAAVTSVGVRAMAMAPAREFATFRADHPFLFLIRHQSTRAILFMGRVSNPQ
jgi:serpin B